MGFWRARGCAPIYATLRVPLGAQHPLAFSCSTRHLYQSFSRTLAGRFRRSTKPPVHGRRRRSSARQPNKPELGTTHYYLFVVKRGAKLTKPAVNAINKVLFFLLTVI